jgi:N-acetylglucosaminyldiphosphoundecaprenol N-acetyl-beta-D-mannosaminyltransferase
MFHPPPSPAPWPRQRLLNVWADDPSPQELLQHLSQHGGLVFTINPDHLYHLQRSPAFLAAYRQADLITVDSHYVQLALRRIGRPVQHRVTGSDLVPSLFQHACDHHTGLRVFLLGAQPGVAQQARERINSRYGQELVVGAHGPSMRFVDDDAEIAQVLQMIRDSGANALMVGLGAPKQELWLTRWRQAMPQIKLLLGVGATIDYEAGAVVRAPVWMRRARLEWFYRVATEPRRYLMRYVRNTEFVWWMWQDKRGRYRDPLSNKPTHG